MTRRARQYIRDLVRIDTTNPPGNETAAAEYIRVALAKEGIATELLGPDRTRLNVIARLAGNGARRPLLLMAHTDVVPADPTQWTVAPFAARQKSGYLYGRGTQDDKALLAAHMTVLVEFKRRGVPLARDVILLGEADEEAGSTGIQWLIANAWAKIDAEFAIHEGGYAADTAAGLRLFHVQTCEKIPTRVRLTAQGSAGHGSSPTTDNPVVRLARALIRLNDADQPVYLNPTTRLYLGALSRIPQYEWLRDLLPKLENEAGSLAAANQLRSREPELEAMLRTTLSPTMIEAGVKINVIPSVAVGFIDARRLPTETRDEVLVRFRRIINDSLVTVEPAGGQQMPATEPSPTTTSLYVSMEKVLLESHSNARVVPYMSRGATDGAFLRAKGMAVFGAPIFLRTGPDSRAHGNDERIELAGFDSGVQLLWRIVNEAAAR